MKALLSIGNEEIEEKFETVKELEITDKERNLNTVRDLLEFINIEVLVVNMMLDKDGKLLNEIAEKAAIRNFKIIMLINDFTDFESKKIISSLVSKGVYCYFKISELTQDQIISAIRKYPDEFDFKLLATEVKVKNEGKNDTGVKKIKQTIENNYEVEVVNGLTISLISAAATGKSTVAWILAHLFSERGYKSSLVNIDRYYSCNVLLGALEETNAFFPQTNDIYERALSINENFNLFTGPFCGKGLETNMFRKYLDVIRTKSDITIVDCDTGINENMRTAIVNSNVVLFIFDMDNLHTRLNIKMIEALDNDINYSKIVVVINNAYKDIQEYNSTIKFIKSIDKGFRDIVTIKNSGKSIYESIFTSKNPCLKDKGFGNDFEILMRTLNARRQKRGILSNLLKR